ncbi:MAG: TonB-dependent receptor [Candidatus Kapabacteria bacterium]|nr:TonB-dependent receptor [Candidatus Kapabacteria bacterium]
MSSSIVHIAVIITCLTFVATAQTPRIPSPRDSVKKRSDTTTYVMPEVVVTAVRAEENILEIPLAITIVPAMVLQTQRGFGIDGLLSLVPGVIGQSRSGGIDSRVQIRGFGARGAGQRSNAGTSRGIRFYTDGIPETEPDGRTSFDLINTVHASRVEVIRSNASTLWGNAAGGVVSVSTIPASRAAFADASVSLGSFGFLRQSLLANTPMGDGQAYVSVTNTALDGWRQHSRGFQTLGTVGLITKPAEHTSVNVFVTGATNQYEIPGPLTVEQWRADPQQAQTDTTIYKPSFDQRDEHRNNRLVRIGTTVDHSFSIESGLSATAFVQSKKLQRSERNTWRDFNRFHIGGNAIYRNTQILNAEMQNRVLVGGDVQYQDGAVLFYNLNSTTKGRGTTLRQNKREAALNVGAFVQDEFMSGPLSITAGLRYDAITYNNQDYINPLADTSATYSRLIPKLGLTYRLAPLANFYANLGGGIEVPAGNETDPPAVIGVTTPNKSINPLLKPIVSTTYEVGVKGITNMDDGFLRSLQYDAAAFYIDIENDIAPYNSGAFFTTIGKSRRMGFEFGGVAVSEMGLTLAASLTVMSTEYVDYVIDSGYIDTSLVGRSSNYAGNEQSGIPPFNATIRLRYDVPFISGLYAEIESRTTSSYFADDANTITVDGWSTLSATAGVRVQLLTLQLALDVLARVDNLTDVSYMGSAWINPDITQGGTPFIESGLPRNVMLTVGLHYTP